ncbi:MAG: XTP/dITP diphosphatase [Promethearchaeia archaeon]
MKPENFRKSLYFVTGNPHKFKEVKEIISEEIDDYRLKHGKLPTVEIQSNSLEEVAKYKLKSVKDGFSNSCFVEDAGFFIETPLKGFPGVYSSYVHKTIGNEGILKLIDNFENSVAHFSAVIALYFKPTEEIMVFTGKTKGKVSNEQRGQQGFGYDPIFIPKKYPDKTFGELTVDEKNTISHRSRALQKLISFLKKQS